MDDIFQDQKFKNVCSDILKYFKNKPFLCTFMSAALLSNLERIFLDRSFKITTGDLLYKDCILFQQNIDLNLHMSGENNVINTEWDGHCWVELDNKYIIDISLFRTIYSDAFTKPCKQDILDTFGVGRGCLIMNKQHCEPFSYVRRNVLQDGIIDGILKAVSEHRDQFLNCSPCNYRDA